MTEFCIRSLGRLTERQGRDVDGVDQWAWADHQGFHVATAFPVHEVPTGYVWGWGQGVWVRWRTDTSSEPVGAELRQGAGLAGYVDARVDTSTGSDFNAVPAVTQEGRFLRTAADTPESLLRTDAGGSKLTLLRVISPVALLFFSLPTLR